MRDWLDNFSPAFLMNTKTTWHIKIALFRCLSPFRGYSVSLSFRLSSGSFFSPPVDCRATSTVVVRKAFTDTRIFFCRWYLWSSPFFPPMLCYVIFPSNVCRVSHAWGQVEGFYLPFFTDKHAPALLFASLNGRLWMKCLLRYLLRRRFFKIHHRQTHHGAKKSRAKLKIGFLLASRWMQSGFCGAGSASASRYVHHELVEFTFGEKKCCIILWSMEFSNFGLRFFFASCYNKYFFSAIPIFREKCIETGWVGSWRADHVLKCSGAKLKNQVNWLLNFNWILFLLKSELTC